MKLRNKKTGHVGEFDIECIKERGDFLKVVSNDGPYYEIKEECGNLYYYDTLAEFNNDWEDYKPAELLIKDEKIRKFARDWATFNKIKKARVNVTSNEARGIEPSWLSIIGLDENGCSWEIEIHADYFETVSKDYKGETVPITELCGEEF